MEGSVVQSLIDQRDFLLANTWVPHTPNEAGQGCLVASMWNFYGVLSPKAVEYVQRALRLPANTGEAPANQVGSWNDHSCKSSGEAISVLDEAIRLAKEDL